MEEIVQGLALNPTYKAQKGRIDYGIQSLAISTTQQETLLPS